MDWKGLIEADRDQLQDATAPELDGWIARHAEPTPETVREARAALAAAGIDYWPRAAKAAREQLRGIQADTGIVLRCAWDVDTRRWAIVDGHDHLVGAGTLPADDRSAPEGCTPAQFGRRIVGLALYAAAEVGKLRSSPVFARIEVPTRSLPYDAIALDAQRLGQPYRVVQMDTGLPVDLIAAETEQPRVRVRDGARVVATALAAAPPAECVTPPPEYFTALKAAISEIAEVRHAPRL